MIGRLSDPRPRLFIAPCGITLAKAYVARWHRHNDPPTSGLQAALVVDADGWAHGVAVLSRPVSRVLQGRGYWEVVRVATDGTRNACSALYGWASRTARRDAACSGLVTYTRVDEPGGSLRASGWVETGRTRPRKDGWKTRTGRRRSAPIEKVRWEPPWSVVAVSKEAAA